MASYPLPYKKFLERIKTGELPGLKCVDCSGHIIPPNAVCPDCGSSKLEAHSFSKKGTLRTFTIIRVGPTGFQVPYIVVGGFGSVLFHPTSPYTRNFADQTNMNPFMAPIGMRASSRLIGTPAFS